MFLHTGVMLVYYIRKIVLILFFLLARFFVGLKSFKPVVG